VSTRGQLHHDMECKSEGESSDDSVVTKDTYHSAVDSEQSLVPDNACQRPTNDFFLSQMTVWVTCHFVMWRLRGYLAVYAYVPLTIWGRN